MRCGFCFSTYTESKSELPKGHLEREPLLEIIDEIARHGARKLTFVGGEPTLCPWLGELISRAKSRGMTTMLVSNGWKLRDLAYLERELEALDWLTLSVDSVNECTNRASGRAHGGRGVMSAKDLLCIGAHARKLGKRLKLNTVVHAINAEEDLSSFVAGLRPQRWKLFQVLPVDGQNGADFARFQLSGAAFERYLERHRWVAELGIDVVPENNAQMRGTYAMIDPRGRFYDAVDGRYRYSQPLLKVGVSEAWRQVQFSSDGFLARGGRYSWDVSLEMLTRPRGQDGDPE